MKQNIIIIHGAYGHPNENWMKIINECDKYFDSDTIIIDHSLGVALILRKLVLLSEEK